MSGAEVKHDIFRQASRLMVAMVFILQSILPARAYAQPLPQPGAGLMVEAGMVYQPLVMSGVRVHPENPLLMDFMLNRGQSELNAGTPAFKAETQKLIKYFLASLAISENDVWVNLSPVEHDRVMNDRLEQTLLGRDMLAQDYVLKQLTASLMYPENELGKEFWKQIYAAGSARFGSLDIPADAFNKVWITADKARMYVHGNQADVVEAHLKVMLESDVQAAGVPSGRETAPANDLSVRNALRSVLLPAIEKEVNEGKNFARLRQMFYAMILATWYKKTLKDSLLNRVYTDKGKTGGALSNDPRAKERIYAQYLETFRKGMFNYIREETDPVSGEAVPRKYFSGGISSGVSRVLDDGAQASEKRSSDDAMATVAFRQTSPEPDKSDRAMTALDKYVVETLAPVVRALSDRNIVEEIILHLNGIRHSRFSNEKLHWLSENPADIENFIGAGSDDSNVFDKFVVNSLTNLVARIVTHEMQENFYDSESVSGYAFSVWEELPDEDKIKLWKFLHDNQLTHLYFQGKPQKPLFPWHMFRAIRSNGGFDRLDIVSFRRNNNTADFAPPFTNLETGKPMERKEISAHIAAVLADKVAKHGPLAGERDRAVFFESIPPVFQGIILNFDGTEASVQGLFAQINSSNLTIDQLKGMVAAMNNFVYGDAAMNAQQPASSPAFWGSAESVWQELGRNDQEKQTSYQQKLRDYLDSHKLTAWFVDATVTAGQVMAFMDSDGLNRFFDRSRLTVRTSGKTLDFFPAWSKNDTMNVSPIAPMVPMSAEEIIAYFRDDVSVRLALLLFRKGWEKTKLDFWRDIFKGILIDKATPEERLKPYKDALQLKTPDDARKLVEWLHFRLDQEMAATNDGEVVREKMGKYLEHLPSDRTTGSFNPAAEKRTIWVVYHRNDEEKNVSGDPSSYNVTQEVPVVKQMGFLHPDSEVHWIRDEQALEWLQEGKKPDAVIVDVYNFRWEEVPLVDYALDEGEARIRALVDALSWTTDNVFIYANMTSPEPTNRMFQFLAELESGQMVTAVYRRMVTADEYLLRYVLGEQIVSVPGRFYGLDSEKLWQALNASERKALRRIMNDRDRRDLYADSQISPGYFQQALKAAGNNLEHRTDLLTVSFPQGSATMDIYPAFWDTGENRPMNAQEMVTVFNSSILPALRKLYSGDRIRKINSFLKEAMPKGVGVNHFRDSLVKEAGVMTEDYFTSRNTSLDQIKALAGAILSYVAVNTDAAMSARSTRAERDALRQQLPSMTKDAMVSLLSSRYLGEFGSLDLTVLNQSRAGHFIASLTAMNLATSPGWKTGELERFLNDVLRSQEASNVLVEKIFVFVLDAIDDAMAVSQDWVQGGIELDGRRMGLEIAGRGEPLNVPADPAMLAAFGKGNFSGLEGVILRIVPLTLTAP